jgi:hypothetical protein
MAENRRSESPIPVFAIVGRVNEGKSSIVAALTENENIEISAIPGTTKVSAPFDIVVNGESVMTIVDTPGFQEPERALAWMRRHASTALERPTAVRAFVENFRGSGEFADECQLLMPIIDGAFVLYVVDSGHPFRPTFEDEMEILRWTGRPRMALINRIGPKDFTADWQQALSQYFSTVRIFNAHQSRFEDRLSLLKTLRELEPTVSPALARATEALEQQQNRRYLDSARIIAQLLIDGMSFSVREPASGREMNEADKSRLIAAYQQGVRQLEEESRRAVERIFNYQKLIRTEPAVHKPVFEQDIFSDRTWEILGLSKPQTIAVGAAVGSMVGASIDLAVGGASLLAGTLIGGALGAVGVAWATSGSPQVQFMGSTVAGDFYVVGPNRNPNFPWVLLDRAVLHFRSVLNRSHARRDELELDRSDIGIVSHLPQSELIHLGKALAKAQRWGLSPVAFESLAQRIVGILRQEIRPHSTSSH